MKTVKTPRPDRKPSPRDMRGWIREVIGAHKFISEAKTADYQPNAVWIAKQHLYWQSRLEFLLSTPPPLPSRYYWPKIQEYIKSIARPRGRPPGKVKKAAEETAPK